MLKQLSIFCFLLSAISGHAQVNPADPVQLTYSSKPAGKQTYELRIVATMAAGWHIYSQSQPAEAISEPTKIIFNKNPLVSLSGKTKETGDKEKYEDKASGIIQYQYGNKVEFFQVMVLKANVKTSISGSITYQACTTEQCLPPKTVSFKFDLYSNLFSNLFFPTREHLLKHRFHATPYLHNNLHAICFNQSAGVNTSTLF